MNQSLNPSKITSQVNINPQSSMINDTTLDSPRNKFKCSLITYANVIKGYFYVICISNAFSFCITLCIVLNTVILALDKFPEDGTMNKTYNTINTVLTWIFFGEMLIKIFGLGPA